MQGIFGKIVFFILHNGSPYVPQVCGLFLVFAQNYMDDSTIYLFVYPVKYCG